MRKLAVWLLLQALIVVSDVNGFSLSELISVLHPLSISTSNSAQQFEGWGTSLAWFAEYVGGLAGSQQDIVADLLFDPDAGLGMEIVRFNIGGSNTTQEAVNSMRPFAAVPSVLLADGSYDWALDNKQAAVMQAAKERGAIIFEAFSNSPPWFMTNSGDPSGNLGGADNLAPAYYDVYVDYLTNVVQYYRDELNITFSTVEPFNEPSSKVWQLGNGQEGCHYGASTQQTILQKLAVSLREKGLNSDTGIAASDEADYGQSIEMFLQYGDSLSVIDQINTHSYPEAVEELAQFPLEAVATKAGKRLWMSEYASGNYAVADIRTGLDLSTQVLGDLKVGKVQAWVYWQAVENLSRSGTQWGLMQMPFDNNSTVIPIQISKQYYALLQYSKFIKNGWTILDTTQDERTLAAMYQHQNSSTEMIVVTTNTDTSSITTNWDFGSTSPVQYALELYRTSASENFARLPNVLLPMSGNLQYDLPAQSISTFHFTYVAAATLATAG